MWEVFSSAWTGYAGYLVGELTRFHARNYLLWLVVFSFLCLGLETWRPWREEQHSVQHSDFWLDLFYLVFNFALFPLLGFQAVWTLVEHYGLHLGSLLGLDLASGYFPQAWPAPLRILVLCVLRDFIQWNVHRLLHRNRFLWRFHAIHHSSKEMGFATHFRFHPLESLLYRSTEYLPLALLGFGATDMFVGHLAAILIGHLNHTNVRIPLGPLKYIFNNPQMHRWHHAKVMPSPAQLKSSAPVESSSAVPLQARVSGVNFGLSLSVWDYLFGSAYIPEDGRDVPLGVSGVKVPSGFLAQCAMPFRKEDGAA